MSVPSGVRLLVNRSAGGPLCLKDGEWFFGKTTIKLDGDNDQTFQQWLLVPVPGQLPDTVALLNVQTGTYAGVWRDEWSSSSPQIRCARSHLAAANIRFRLEVAEEKNSTVRLVWLGDTSQRVLGVNSKGTVVLRKMNDSSDATSARTSWLLRDLQVPYEIFPRWMHSLPDDIRLDHVNLPATHQTLANHGIGRVRPKLNWSGFGDSAPRPWLPLPTFVDNPRCQEVSLWGQLQMGIRALDIRLDLDYVSILQHDDGGTSRKTSKYILYARHGLAEMGYSWSAALLTLQAFLRTYPSETVFVNVRYETVSNSGPNRWSDWLATFVDETSPFWQDSNNPIVYEWWKNGARLMTDLTLADVRGKVILTADLNYMPTDEREGRNRGMRFYPHNMVAVGKWDSKRDEWDRHIQDCESNLIAAKANVDSSRYFQTSLNVSGLPSVLRIVYTLRSIFARNPLMLFRNLRDGKQDRANEVFDPIDFMQYLLEAWQTRGSEHPFSEQQIGKNGQYRIGKVDFDFCDLAQPWIANIVRSNRTRAGYEF